MFKKIFIIIILIALLLLLFGMTLFKDNNTGQSTDTQVDEQEPTKTEMAKQEALVGTGSLNDLTNQNKNLECDISHTSVDNPNERIEGTYFISANRTRGDFILPQGMVSSVIIDNDTMYTWSLVEGEAYGMKVDLEFLQTLKDNDQDESVPPVHEPVPRNAEISYNCQVWSDVDSSMFEPPSDILFRDYKEIIGTGMEYGTVYEEQKGSQEQCSACLELSTESETEQCLTALRCE